MKMVTMLAMSLLLMAATPEITYAALSIDEMEALAAMQANKATPKQKALLFMRNDAINRARLNGWISDDLYQAAQSDFSATNQRLAKDAADAAGADFTVQQRTSQTYSPGTDSDYITKVDSPDQVRQMQKGYNERVNKYLADNGYGDVKRTDWHNRLDTDFMADPGKVTKEQFEEIAKLNNDAYRRPGAAEYERVSRAGDGTRVSPDQFRDYASEMRDFVKKKQRYMDELRKNPMRLQSPEFRAEFQKMMAQEQKYISRIESATDLLRKQEGLGALDRGLWEVVKDQDGSWVMRQKDSIAKLGARRAPGNFGRSAAASAVADNSLNRALEDLADAYGDAAGANHTFRANAASDIAELLESMPPSQKGAFLDALNQKQGAVFTGEVAAAMRERAASNFSKWSGRAMKSLEIIGIAADLYQAGQYAKAYIDAYNKAMDPALSDEEAAKFFAEAQEAAQGLALTGGLGALMEAYPPVAAAFGVWTVTYEGGKYILANSETGERINRSVSDYFDRHMRALEAASCDAKEFLGYESECERLREVDRGVLAATILAIKEGRKNLVPGKSMRDIAELIRSGQYNKIQEILIDGPRLVASQEAIAGLAAGIVSLEKQCGEIEMHFALADKSVDEALQFGQLLADRSQEIAQSIGSISDNTLQACANAKTIRGGVIGATQMASRWARQASKGFRGALVLLNRCTSASSAAKADELFDAARKVAGGAGEKYVLAKEGNEVLEKILAGAAQSRGQLAEIDGRIQNLGVNRLTFNNHIGNVTASLANVTSAIDKCNQIKSVMYSKLDSIIKQYPWLATQPATFGVRGRIDKAGSAPPIENLLGEMSRASSLAERANAISGTGKIASMREQLGACEQVEPPTLEIMDAGRAILMLENASDWRNQFAEEKSQCLVKLDEATEGPTSGSSTGGGSTGGSTGGSSTGDSPGGPTDVKPPVEENDCTEENWRPDCNVEEPEEPPVEEPAEPPVEENDCTGENWRPDCDANVTQPSSGATPTQIAQADQAGEDVQETPSGISPGTNEEPVPIPGDYSGGPARSSPEGLDPGRQDRIVRPNDGSDDWRDEFDPDRVLPPTGPRTATTLQRPSRQPVRDSHEPTVTGAAQPPTTVPAQTASTQQQPTETSSSSGETSKPEKPTKKVPPVKATKKKYGVYLLFESKSALWVGAEAALKGRARGSFAYGGMCRDAEKCPITYTLKKGPFTSFEKAKKAYCEDYENSWYSLGVSRVKMSYGVFAASRAPSCSK